MCWFLLGLRKKAELLTDGHHDALDAAWNTIAALGRPSSESRHDAIRVCGVDGEVRGKSGPRDVEGVYEAVHGEHRLQRAT